MWDDLCVGEEVLQFSIEVFSLLLSLDQVFHGLLQLGVVVHVLQSLFGGYQECVFEVAFQLRDPASHELQVFLELLVSGRWRQDVLNDALLDGRHCFAFRFYKLALVAVVSRKWYRWWTSTYEGRILQIVVVELEVKLALENHHLVEWKMLKTCINRWHPPILIEMWEEGISNIELSDTLQPLRVKVISVVHELT